MIVEARTGSHWAGLLSSDLFLVITPCPMAAHH